MVVTERRARRSSSTPSGFDTSRGDADDELALRESGAGAHVSSSLQARASPLCGRERAERRWVRRTPRMRATAAIDASRNASGAAAAAGGGGTRHSRRASMGIGRKEGIENLDFVGIEAYL